MGEGVVAAAVGVGEVGRLGVGEGLDAAVEYNVVVESSVAGVGEVVVLGMIDFGTDLRVLVPQEAFRSSLFGRLESVD